MEENDEIGWAEVRVKGCERCQYIYRPSKRDWYLRQRIYNAEAKVKVNNVWFPQVVGNNDIRVELEDRKGRQVRKAKQEM